MIVECASVTATENPRCRICRGDDPAYARLLGTAQEILREEIDGIRRLVDDFSAFAKLPKVDPAPVDLTQVVEDFLRAHGAAAVLMSGNGHAWTGSRSPT